MAEKPIQTIDWKKESQRFDGVADLYDTYRPSYPAQLIEDIISISGIEPDSSILEIGSGTGKATLLFARRGYAVLCVEPGQNLIDVAKKNLAAYPHVSFIRSRFEEWQAHSDQFDLVFSAQAFHWVPDKIRYQKTARVLTLPGLVFILLPLPHLLMAAILPQPVLTFGAGGWGFLQYIFFLIGGFIIISSHALQDLICRQRWISLILGMTGLTGLVICQTLAQHQLPVPPAILYFFYHITNLLCAWSLLLAMIGFGKKHLTFTDAFNQFANEAVLPFYILHQSVLVCLGYFIVQFNFHDVFKWGIITVASFAICMGLYTFIIRKTDLLRFLFGMKTKSIAFQAMRKPLPQILLLLLFIAPMIVAESNKIRAQAFFSDSKLPRVIYTYEGSPSFSFSYPAKSSKIQNKGSPSQVLLMRTPFGKKFTAAVSNIPDGISLSEFGPKVLFGMVSQKGAQHQVIKNEPVTLNDGTKGYKTVFSKLTADGMRYTIISVSTYKNDKCAVLAVETREEPKEVEWIVESLDFKEKPDRSDEVETDDLDK